MFFLRNDDLAERRQDFFMAMLLRKLPFFDKAKAYSQGHAVFELKPFQILVWITLCRQGPVPYDHAAPLIPAVLDTGFNGGFCVREEHLRSWAGVDPRFFHKVRSTIVSRGAMDVRAANIWLHPNSPDTTDPLRERPLRMELNDGIRVFVRPTSQTPTDPRPELPLLGMQALRRHELFLTVDFRVARVNLYRPRLFYWPMSF